MRISSNLFFQTGLNSINAQQADLMHLYQQIGSGQRMVTPADDPLAAAQAINLAQAQSLNKRFADNREVLKNDLATEENVLGSVTLLLQDIKTRLVEAGNGTLSDADRATLANVLSNAKDNLLGLANSTDGKGQYLFSGHAGSQQAFVEDANGKVSYNGDAGRRLIQADQTRQIAGSDLGSDIFTQASAGSRAYVSSAGSGNVGNGLISAPVIIDPQGVHVGKKFEIEFSDSTDSPPVLQYTVRVKDADGNLVAQPTPPQAYSSGTTTLTLPGGVQVGFSGVPVAGDSFSAEPANTQPAVGFKITPDPAQVSDLLVSAPVIQDEQAERFGNPFTLEYLEDPDNPGSEDYQYWIRFHDDPPGTPLIPVGLPDPLSGRLDLPETGLSVVVSGTPEPGDAVAITPGSSQPTNLNIFDTLDGLIAALNTPIHEGPAAQAMMQNTLSGAIQRIDLNYNQVLTVRSSAGARLNELDAIDANGTLRNLGYTAQLSRLQDLDYYTATAQLQLRQSALEAAALAFKQIQGTSLFNMGMK